MFFQPGGSIFLTTINKTQLSYALAIVAAEYLLGLVEKGSHDWNKFISPEDLSKLLEASKLCKVLVSCTLLTDSMFTFITEIVVRCF